MGNTLESIQKLDAYPKTKDDYQVKTQSGAIISIISVTFIVYLLITELMYLFTTSLNTELYVDSTIGETLQINFDISFPEVPCDYLSIDLMSSSGTHSLDVKTNVYKKKLNSNEAPTPLLKTGSFISQPMTESELGRSTPETVGCGDCYGAKEGCCNTCQEVLDAYAAKGWAVDRYGKSFSQCQNEGFEQKMKSQEGSGCQIYGYLTTDKVQGNFHFAPGRPTTGGQSHGHNHDLSIIGAPKLDFRHTIHSLSFGREFPDYSNPLDGTKRDNPNTKVYGYYLTVVPTKYIYLDGLELETNQFTVAEYASPKTASGIPGIFFNYDISPLVVEHRETRKSFSTFLVTVSAVLGGVYAAAGLVDHFVYQGLRTLKKKRQLGKDI